MAIKKITTKRFPPHVTERIDCLISRGLACECWIWLGHLDQDGYGLIKFDGTIYRAHRLIFFIYNGVDPLDKFVCHSCDNPPCVNPLHLWLGTTQQNTQDMVNKGRGVHGHKQHSSKLTEEQAKTIKYDSELASERTVYVAKRFGVSNTAISRIRNGINWKHI